VASITYFFNILRSLRQKINRKGPYSTIELSSEFAKLYPVAGCWSLVNRSWPLALPAAKSR
jgi:hypothetical protein